MGMRILTTLVILGGVGSAGWWGYTNYVQPRGAAGLRTRSKTLPEPARQWQTFRRRRKPLLRQRRHRCRLSPRDLPRPRPQSRRRTMGPRPRRRTNNHPLIRPLPHRRKPKISHRQNHHKKSRRSPQRRLRKKPTRRETRQPACVARKATTVEEKPVKTAPAVAPPEGEALFRRGEAYLYGRGVAENCDQAIKYLKSASDKSHAKARSAFGTMYATGHCVPRDLPTSYRWFALALRVDPNNQILEKDLSAVWNQMTPPERQLATKSQ